MKPYLYALCLLLTSGSTLFSNTQENPRSITTSNEVQNVSESFGHIVYKNIKEKIKFVFDAPSLIRGLHHARDGKASPMSHDMCLQVLNSSDNNLNADKIKLSEAFGHVIIKDIIQIGYPFDIELFIKGFSDASESKVAPLKDNDCLLAINTNLQNRFNTIATKNLEEAENFLKANALKDGICCLENNKLQYKIDQTGRGKVVQEHSAPLLSYTGKFLNGEVFDFSKEPITLPLDKTIVGFSKGICGMKEGEKRTLFIHPEIAYGTQPGSRLPPNSMLIFHIEIIKAN